MRPFSARRTQDLSQSVCPSLSRPQTPAASPTAKTFLPLPFTEPTENLLKTPDAIGSGFSAFAGAERHPSRQQQRRLPLPSPRPAPARPSRAAAPGLAPPPRAQPQRPGPPRPHAPAPEGRSQSVRQKGPGENLCRRAVLYKARSALLPPPDSPGLRAGPAKERGRGRQPPAPGRGRTAAPKGAGSSSRVSPRAGPAPPHGFAFC